MKTEESNQKSRYESVCLYVLLINVLQTETLAYSVCVYLWGLGVLFVQSVVLFALVLVLTVILLQLLAHSVDVVLFHQLSLNHRGQTSHKPQETTTLRLYLEMMCVRVIYCTYLMSYWMSCLTWCVLWISSVVTSLYYIYRIMICNKLLHLWIILNSVKILAHWIISYVTTELLY